MRIMQELIHHFYQKNLIIHSQLKNIFTKYGSFQAKIYKDGHHEYLVIMSRNFFELTAPIVYIYSESHDCNVIDHETCYCNHQIDIALKMIRKNGGVIVYYSRDVRSIDGLLKELCVREIDTISNVMTKEKIKLDLKMDQREFQSIGFIFKDLKILSMKLIAHDINVVHVSQKLNIEIIKRISHITFDYGEND